MDEDTPLTRPLVNRPSYGWWALQLGIAIFVFLAFLFSVLAFSVSNKTNQQITNNAIWSSSSLRHTYKVNAARNVRKGTVVSFCEEHRICEGLGPVWNHRPFRAPGGPQTAAAHATLTQLSPANAVYVWASIADHTLIQAATISTMDEPGVRAYGTYQLQYPLTSLRTRALVEHSLAHSWAMLYTDHNVTYIQVGTSANNTISFGEAIPLFSLDPLDNFTYVSDLSVAETWVIITYGRSHDAAATYVVYELDHSQPQRLRRINFNAAGFAIPPRGLISSAYLGNGTFIQSCANHLQIGKINFQNPALTLLNYADFPAYFRTLHITPMHLNRIAFTGVQVDYVDEPVALSMVVEYYPYAPYVAIYYPVNLLATHEHALVNYQLHVCYHTPYTAEPFGGLFFTYVDARSLMAKIVRAKVIQTSYSQIQLLPSPSLDLSSTKYGTYGSWFAPLISCPTSNEEILLAYQDQETLFDTFTWSGGFRFAGVAETEGKEGEEVTVVRAGVANGFTGLQTGFQYYVYNDGFLAPHTSYLELFNTNGHRQHIGVAISPTELLLEWDAFEPRD